MVQLAVAFHHHSKGNFVGARSVLERGMQNLDGAERSFPSLDLDQLRAELDIWRRCLETCESASDVAATPSRRCQRLGVAANLRLDYSYI